MPTILRDGRSPEDAKENCSPIKDNKLLSSPKVNKKARAKPRVISEFHFANPSAADETKELERLKEENSQLKAQYQHDKGKGKGKGKDYFASLSDPRTLPPPGVEYWNCEECGRPNSSERLNHSAECCAAKGKPDGKGKHHQGKAKSGSAGSKGKDYTKGDFYAKGEGSKGKEGKPDRWRCDNCHKVGTEDAVCTCYTKGKTSKGIGWHFEKGKGQDKGKGHDKGKTKDKGKSTNPKGPRIYQKGDTDGFGHTKGICGQIDDLGNTYNMHQDWEGTWHKFITHYVRISKRDLQFQKEIKP